MKKTFGPIEQCPSCGERHEIVIVYKLATGTTMAKCPNKEGLSCFCLDRYLYKRKIKAG